MIAPELQETMDYWDGFGVQIEWYIRRDGLSALGIVGDADNMQIMSIDTYLDGESVMHTEQVEFSTGGPEL